MKVSKTQYQLKECVRCVLDQKGGRLHQQGEAGESDAQAMRSTILEAVKMAQGSPRA